MPPRLTCAFLQSGSAILAALLTMSAHAQGGPPLVTDDPGTPGSGNWEINAAATGAQNRTSWELAAPDLDINYGWGEHVQLKVDLNWALARTEDGRRISGLGATDFGVKWRFVDQDRSGFALSIYPQLSTNLAPSSAARGLIADGRAFFLPAEISTEYGAFRLDAEVGRNFVQRGQDAWLGGVVVAHACGPDLECGFELHGSLIAREFQPLANFGVHWQAVKHVILLAAIGHGFGSSEEDSERFLFYFGFQLLKES